MVSVNSSYEISVKSFLGIEFCMTGEQGHRLYVLIHPLLKAGKKVTLDFKGVPICIPPFMHESMGVLMRDIPRERVGELLTIKNLNPIATETLRLVMENAQEYWTDISVRSAVDSVITRQSREGLDR